MYIWPRLLTTLINIENLLGERYYVNAHNNNNISPGAPFGVTVSVGASF